MRSLQKEKIGEKRYVSTENPCSLWHLSLYRWLFLTGGWPAGDGGRHLHFLLILLLLAWLNYLDENGRSHLTGQFIISAVFSFWNTLTNYKNLSVCKVYAVYFRFPLSRQVIHWSFHPPHWTLRDVLSPTQPRILSIFNSFTDLYTRLHFRTFESL